MTPAPRRADALSCPDCQRPLDAGGLAGGAWVACACGGGARVPEAPVAEPVRASPAPTTVPGGRNRVPSGSVPLDLDELGVTPTLPPSTRHADTPLAVAPPVELPGYELVQVLGRGGMGEVWRARQTSLGRTVAVKLLPERLAQDPEFVARFEKEATALAALSHPNVTQIIDRGRVGQTYYFVMEFVDGRPLRELLGRVSPREALSIVLQVLRGVEAAHERGIVHRDLKPENILVDARGRVKVVDFGLAGVEGGESRLRVTQSAVAMGTLHYMAPEQRRDARSVDGRADLFSVGVVLYELLTGELPVGRFKLPSERVNGIGPGVAERLDAVVARLLETEPEARYAGAHEVVEALEPLVAEAGGATPSGARPAAAARSSVAQGVRSGLRTLRAGLAVVGGLVLLGLGARVLWGERAVPATVLPSGVLAPAPVAQPAPAPLPPRGYPPNTDSELFLSASEEVELGGGRRLRVDFEEGDEELNAWAGDWKLKDGRLEVVQAGSETGGKRLIPRAYLAHRYFSTDDFAAEVRMEVRPLPPEFHDEPEAQHFGELALRIRDLQVSAYAIPDAGMRLAWRYLTPSGDEVVGNSSQDLEDLVEDEMPLPRNGPFRVRLSLQRRNNAVVVQAYVNDQRFARKVLPGLQGRVGKVALGCRNLACSFETLHVRGAPAKQPKSNPGAD